MLQWPLREAAKARSAARDSGQGPLVECVKAGGCVGFLGFRGFRGFVLRALTGALGAQLGVQGFRFSVAVTRIQVCLMVQRVSISLPGRRRGHEDVSGAGDLVSFLPNRDPVCSCALNPWLLHEP